MSIVTLKKKTSYKYNNNSVGYKHFSLNGGYRNQGWVGQSNISRSLPQTYMRGDTMRGYGGCCGTYRITPQITSAIQSTNNNKVMKSSVLSNDGMLATQFRWIGRPQPYTSVKPDTTHNLNNQGDYINRLNRGTICITDNCNPKTNSQGEPIQPLPTTACGSCAVTQLMFKSVLNSAQSFSEPYPNPITKTVEELPVAISQGQYLDQLNGCCVAIDIQFQNQNNKSKVNGVPFACGTAV